MSKTTLDPNAAQAAALAYECPADALKDRVILVTGAGEGIGRAVALALGKAGATVVCTESAYYGLSQSSGPNKNKFMNFFKLMSLARIAE